MSGRLRVSAVSVSLRLSPWKPQVKKHYLLNSLAFMLFQKIEIEGVVYCGSFFWARSENGGIAPGRHLLQLSPFPYIISIYRTSRRSRKTHTFQLTLYKTLLRQPLKTQGHQILGSNAPRSFRNHRFTPLQMKLVFEIIWYFFPEINGQHFKVN